MERHRQGHHDAYTETLQKAIEQKLAGQEIHIPTPGTAPKVVDLMQALQASLNEGGRRPPAKATGRRAAQAAAAPSIGLGGRTPHPPSI